MLRTVCFLLTLFLGSMVHAQDKPAYALFDKEGNPATYAPLVEAAAGHDYVFFGELHNNPIAHWLQLELTQDLYEAVDSQLILGAEMFEADNQLLLDEYLLGQISTKNFEDEARLWNNYATDYKPLVEFARSHQLYFVASNIPRRYANLVYREGVEQLEDLPQRSKAFMAPLPMTIDLEQPAYKEMMEMMGGHGGDGAETLAQAQAVKDATMAHFIGENWRPGYTLIHYNGSYHSNQWQGIVWYVQQNTPDRSVLTINTVEQADISKLSEENSGLADFTICVPSTMTKTY